MATYSCEWCSLLVTENKTEQRARVRALNARTLLATRMPHYWLCSSSPAWVSIPTFSFLLPLFFFFFLWSVVWNTKKWTLQILVCQTLLSVRGIRIEREGKDLRVKMFIKKSAWTKRNCCTIWCLLFHSNGTRHTFSAHSHLQGNRKNNVCALWRAGKSLRCWCHLPAPPRGPNCWVPVYHGVSGGRPRWAADSRLTQGPRIVLPPNALFFWDTYTQHNKHSENTERFMMIRIGQLYWNQITIHRTISFLGSVFTL